MNTSEQLTRGLQEQADRIGGHPIDLESVRGRARGIQRRRRIAAGAAAAAVLAVAVPAGMTVLDGGDAARPQPAPPAPSIEPAPRNDDGSYLLSPQDAPDGVAPKVDYIVLDERRLVTPDGSVELPGDFMRLAPYGEGWIGIEAGEFPPLGTRVVELSEDLEPTAGPTSGTSLVSSDDGSRVAWTEHEDGSWMLVNAPTDGGEATRTSLPGNENTPAEVIGFLADGSVVYSTTDPGTYEQRFGVAGPEGQAFDGFNTLVGTSEASGLVAGQTKYLGDGSCSAVADPLSGDKPLWETCDHSLGQFSPDGRYIVGLAPYFDGPGSPSLAILDARTGAPLVEYSGDNDRRSYIGVDQVVWEDPDTVLATVTQDSDQAIVRVELDGAVSEAARSLRTSGLSIEYRFPQLG